MNATGTRVARVSRATFLTALLFSAQAMASTFGVTPVRVYLGASKSIGVVTLHNADSHPVTVQAEPVRWTQRDGRDEYAASDDLIVSPPVFTVPANADQIVRIGLRAQPNPTLELAYRIYFQEVPGKLSSSFSGINITLRLGIPVFIHPQVAGRAQVQWSALRQGSGVLVQAKNIGTEHLQLQGFTARTRGKGLEVKRPRYLLPGSSASWLLPSASGSAGATVYIDGMSDEGPLSVAAPISPQ